MKNKSYLIYNFTYRPKDKTWVNENNAYFFILRKNIK